MAMAHHGASRKNERRDAQNGEVGDPRRESP
jgi:hypothetical protein